MNKFLDKINPYVDIIAVVICVYDFFRLIFIGYRPLTALLMGCLGVLLAVSDFQKNKKTKMVVNIFGLVMFLMAVVLTVLFQCGVSFPLIDLSAAGFSLS